MRGDINKCIETEVWAHHQNVLLPERIFREVIYFGCLLTTHFFWIVMLSIPEILLYSITFFHIITRTNRTALTGMLNPEVMKKRRQRNNLNIMMTFWTWIAQFMSNTIYMSLTQIFYGKIRFYHAFLAVFSLCLNFNILPFFYILLGDDDFKIAILSKDVMTLLNLFFKY
jgi:hypothetical protein